MAPSPPSKPPHEAHLEDDEEDVQAVASDDEGEEEEEVSDQPDASTALTAKQRKKKKSKAAAKLRKKIGLGGGDKKEDALSAASTSGASGPILSDEDVNQLQKAIEREQGPGAAARADRATLEKLMKMMNLERTAMLKDHDAKQKQYKTLAEHKFWKTQPVTKPDDQPLLSTDTEGPIQPSVPREQVRQEPYPLPNDFEWTPVDIDDEGQLKEVYDLLTANYVEDVDASLRFNYSPEFLHWVLKHPGYRKSWHIGVRVTSTRKLVAFISAIPHELRVRQQAYPSAEVNFLCVHKKLRSKRLAPVLIKEITRQCHLTGIFQAIYTGGIVLPTPIACARYYHRTINAEKLLDVGFSGLRPGMTRAAFVAQYKLPADTKVKGLREMRDDDVPAVGKLMRRYQSRFDMSPRFTDEEVRHVLLSGRGGSGRKQVAWTYVVEDPDSASITDMVSYYSLPSSILDSERHKTLEAAYLFYYASSAAFEEGRGSQATSNAQAAGLQHTNLSATEQEDEQSVTNWADESPEQKARLKARLNSLIQDILILASKQGFDVLNCLTVMDNPLFLQEQLFGPGDGYLRHYLFNWRVRPIAGGMGNRPGEAELDPMVQYAKMALEAEEKSSGNKLSTDEKVQRMTAAHPRPERGSGTGIVMV